MVDFGDRIYYNDWQIKQNIIESDSQEVSSFSSHIASSELELRNEIKSNSLEKFFVLKASISRFEWNFVKSFLLIIPPIMVTVVIIGYYKRAVKDEGKSIRFYLSIGFFLTTYFLALNEFVPPTLTLLEIFVIFLMVLSLLFLALEYFHPFAYAKNSIKRLKSKLKRTIDWFR